MKWKPVWSVKLLSIFCQYTALSIFCSPKVVLCLNTEPGEPGEPGEPDEPGEPGEPDEPGEPEITTLGLSLVKPSQKVGLIRR